MLTAETEINSSCALNRKHDIESHVFSKSQILDQTQKIHQTFIFNLFVLLFIFLKESLKPLPLEGFCEHELAWFCEAYGYSGDKYHRKVHKEI